MQSHAIQVFDVKFDTTDDGFEQLTKQEVIELEREIEGQIFEIEADPEDEELEFDYEVCEAISEETGWLVKSFNYRHILVNF